MCPHEAYIPKQSHPIPRRIRGDFKLVHSSLLSNRIIKNTLTILGVKELTRKDIKDIVQTKRIPKIIEKWGELSDKRRIEEIKLFYKLWKAGHVTKQDLNSLTLKAESGKWLPPQELIFPEKYTPDLKLETLIKKKLLDLPVEFVSSEFVKRKSKHEIKSWCRFFEELGVGQKIKDDTEKRKIVERIGILVSRKYEYLKGRKKIKELGESEKRGYDIESSRSTGSKSEKRYIEVKSSSRPNPEIFITANELRALKEKQDKYFIYVVKDALQNPTLCVIRGSEILKILENMQMKVSISFNDLWEVKEDVFKPDC